MSLSIDQLNGPTQCQVELMSVPGFSIDQLMELAGLVRVTLTTYSNHRNIYFHRALHKICLTPRFPDV